MAIKDNLLCTDKVPVWGKDGTKIEEITLPEKIIPVLNRRCGISEKGLYYKGSGIIYTGHFVNEYDSSMKLVSDNGRIYDRYNVIYPQFFRRHGIFPFRHQPMFSDREGGCGLKEQNLIGMQNVFEYTAIDEIVGQYEVPIENHYIYSFRLKDVSGKYSDTIRLLEYSLCNNFNTAWDKNLWADIYCFGYVRDIADWFISDKESHKLGTVYALLHTMRKTDKYLYEYVVKNIVGLEQLSDTMDTLTAAIIVKKYCPNCFANLDLLNPSENTLTELWKILYSGKACCHLENEEEWEFVRKEYMSKIPEKVKLQLKDMKYQIVTKMMH